MNVNPEMLPLTRRAFYLRSGRLRVGLLLLLILAILWGISMFRGLVANFPLGRDYVFNWSSRGCVGTVVDYAVKRSSYVGSQLAFVPADRRPGPFFPAPELTLSDLETVVILPYWLLMAVTAAIVLAVTERQFRGYRAVIQNLPAASGNTEQLRA